MSAHPIHPILPTYKESVPHTRYFQIKNLVLKYIKVGYRYFQGPSDDEGNSFYRYAVFEILLEKDHTFHDFFHPNTPFHKKFYSCNLNIDSDDMMMNQQLFHLRDIHILQDKIVVNYFLTTHIYLYISIHIFYLYWMLHIHFLY